MRRREHVRTGEDIYKIGRTTRGIDRLKEYGTGIEIHGMLPVVGSKEAGRTVIELFDGKYGRIGSSKSYKGNVEDMVKDIKNVCKEHNAMKTSVSTEICSPIGDDTSISSPVFVSKAIEKLDQLNGVKCDFILACESNDSVGARESYTKYKELGFTTPMVTNDIIKRLYNICCTKDYVSIVCVLDDIDTLTVREYFALFRTSCKMGNLGIAKHIFCETLM